MAVCGLGLAEADRTGGRGEEEAEESRTGGDAEEERVGG